MLDLVERMVKLLKGEKIDFLFNIIKIQDFIMSDLKKEREQQFVKKQRCKDIRKAYIYFNKNKDGSVDKKFDIPPDYFWRYYHSSKV